MALQEMANMGRMHKRLLITVIRLMNTWFLNFVALTGNKDTKLHNI